MPQSLLENLKATKWDRMTDVNFKGVLYRIAAVLPHMRQRKSGHIIKSGERRDYLKSHGPLVCSPPSTAKTRQVNALNH